jgi:putative tricarboxylic transport membrane protein
MGSPRFTYGFFKLSEGFEFVIVAMGLFGIGEALVNIERSVKPEVLKAKISGLLGSREEWRSASAPIARGSLIGFLIGVLPGGGATISSFLIYALEKKLSRHPEQFGRGALEGVAAPEAGNNAAATSSFIPLLTLGIPGNASIALIFAALLIHGIRPGPLLIQERPEIFWGLIVSMYLGNFMLLILNLPLIRLWVSLLQVPYPLLAPLIVMFVLVGAYSVNNNASDVGFTVIFGVLAMILGPQLEANLRRSLIYSHGEFMVFVERPIAATLLGLAVLMLLSPLVRRALTRRLGRILSSIPEPGTPAAPEAGFTGDQRDRV